MNFLIVVPTRSGRIVALACLLALAASAQSVPARSGPVRIMLLGDSITRGVPAQGAWRQHLWFDLTSAGYDVDFVGSQSEAWPGPIGRPDYDGDHEGHMGLRTDQVLHQLSAWAFNCAPDIVLVHLGTNDLWQFQGVASTIDELGQVVATLRAANPDVVVLLAEIIPSSQPLLAVAIPWFNAAVPGLAASLGTPASPVLVVDQTSGFDPLQHTYDGVHPNDMGARLMAQRWLMGLGMVLPGLHLSISQSAGSGSAMIRNLGGPPGALYFTAFSFEAQNVPPPPMSVTLSGLNIPLLDLFTQYQILQPPFRGTLNPFGQSAYLFAPGSLAPYTGQIISAITHLVSPPHLAILAASPPVSFTVQ